MIGVVTVMTPLSIIVFMKWSYVGHLELVRPWETVNLLVYIRGDCAE